MRKLRTWCVMALMVLGAIRASAEYTEGPVTNGGSITGRIRVTGEVPVLPPQPVFKHQETCGSTIPDQRLQIGKDGALQSAVVYLADVKTGKPIPRSQPVKLENSKCTFVPHVLTATVGQMIEIHNSDPFLHDAHAWLGAETLFNVGLPKGRTVRRPLAYAGIAHINCNVRHTWMHAYLFVGENPYHTVTGDQGQFTLADVPPGKYTLAVWHEILGNTNRDITVESGKATTVDVELPAAAPEAPAKDSD
jgi:plastocyanin